MNALPITPAPITIRFDQNSLHAKEIRLGASPRGSCIVVTDASSTRGDDDEVMNVLAVHGYESIGLTARSAPGDDDGRAGILAAAEHLDARERVRDNVGLLGVGAGARTVLRSAGLRFAAAVSMSPTEGYDARVARTWLRTASAQPVRTPWLGLFADPGGGGLRPAIDDFGDALDRISPVCVHTVTYGGVAAGFHRDTGGSAVHAASFDAWQRAIEWFNLQVAPCLTDVAKAALAQPKETHDV